MFFLKSRDFENNRPNNNGFNGKVTAVYSNKKLAWDEIYVTMPFTPAHMNTVIVKMWE